MMATLNCTAPIHICPGCDKPIPMDEHLCERCLEESDASSYSSPVFDLILCTVGVICIAAALFLAGYLGRSIWQYLNPAGMP